MKFTTADWISLIAGLVCALGAVVAPAIIVPQFQGAFDSFDVTLPWLTRLFVGHPYVLWALPVTVLLAWLMWPNPRHRALATGLIGVAGSILMVAAVIAAMYLPIFQMPPAH